MEFWRSREVKYCTVTSTSASLGAIVGWVWDVPTYMIAAPAIMHLKEWVTKQAPHKCVYEDSYLLVSDRHTERRVQPSEAYRVSRSHYKADFRQPFLVIASLGRQGVYTDRRLLASSRAVEVMVE